MSQLLTKNIRILIFVPFLAYCMSRCSPRVGSPLRLRMISVELYVLCPFNLSALTPSVSDWPFEVLYPCHAPTVITNTTEVY